MPGLTRVEAAMHGSAAAAFDPSSLSNLLWWHDGTLSAKTTSGSNYTQWNDLSGNARHWAQANTALAPNTGRTINGIIALDFDGTEYMVMATGAGITTTAHIFTVCVIDTVAANDYLYEAGASGASGWWIRQSSSAGRYILRVAPDAVLFNSLDSGTGNVFTAGVALRIEARFAGAGTMGLRFAAGTEVTQTAPNGGCVAPELPSLMAFSSGANPTDGAVAFSCAYSSIKTGTDLTDLRSYINTRFGT